MLKHRKMEREQWLKALAALKEDQGFLSQCPPDGSQLSTNHSNPKRTNPLSWPLWLSVIMHTYPHVDT